jgi:hypothetical protein
MTSRISSTLMTSAAVGGSPAHCRCRRRWRGCCRRPSARAAALDAHVAPRPCRCSSGLPDDRHALVRAVALRPRVGQCGRSASYPSRSCRESDCWCVRRCAIPAGPLAFRPLCRMLRRLQSRVSVGNVRHRECLDGCHSLGGSRTGAGLVGRAWRCERYGLCCLGGTLTCRRCCLHACSFAHQLSAVSVLSAIPHYLFNNSTKLLLAIEQLHNVVFITAMTFCISML